MIVINYKMLFPRFIINYIRFKYYDSKPVRREEFLSNLDYIREDIKKQLETTREKTLIEEVLNKIETDIGTRYQGSLISELTSSLDTFINEYKISYNRFPRFNYDLANFALNLIDVKSNDKVASSDFISNLNTYKNYYLYSPKISENIENDSIYYVKINNTLLLNLLNEKPKTFIYDKGYYDRIINLFDMKELVEFDNNISDKYNSVDPDLAGINLTLDMLNEKGKAVVAVSNYFLKSNSYFLERLELIKNRHIESVINLRFKSLMILSKEKQDYIRFVSFNDEISIRMHSDVLDDIIQEVHSKIESIHSRNISYQALIEESIELSKKYEYYRNLNHRLDDPLDEEEIRFKSIRKASLDPNDYIGDYESEFKNLDSLKTELDKCYKALNKLINKH